MLEKTGKFSGLEAHPFHFSTGRNRTQHSPSHESHTRIPSCCPIKTLRASSQVHPCKTIPRCVINLQASCPRVAIPTEPLPFAHPFSPADPHPPRHPSAADPSALSAVKASFNPWTTRLPHLHPSKILPRPPLPPRATPKNPSPPEFFRPRQKNSLSPQVVSRQGLTAPLKRGTR
jgi:hypothetical protein